MVNFWTKSGLQGRGVFISFDHHHIYNGHHDHLGHQGRKVITHQGHYSLGLSVWDISSVLVLHLSAILGHNIGYKESTTDYSMGSRQYQVLGAPLMKTCTYLKFDDKIVTRLGGMVANFWWHALTSYHIYMLVCSWHHCWVLMVHYEWKECYIGDRTSASNNLTCQHHYIPPSHTKIYCCSFKPQSMAILNVARVQD